MKAVSKFGFDTVHQITCDIQLELLIQFANACGARDIDLCEVRSNYVDAHKKQPFLN